MSRIGKQTIKIPSGVTITLKDGGVAVQGPKGQLFRSLPEVVSVVVGSEGANVQVKDTADNFQRALWGTFSSHLANMVEGVTNGFKKDLEVNGVGYRVAAQGKDLKLELGFSHPINFPMPEGITAVVEKNIIHISGIDKELVGEVAANIRALRKPEPYKGKGIKYVDETIRRKAGKAAKSAAA